MTIYDEGRPKERDAASTPPLNFSGRSLRSPLLSKNVTDLACFYLHFSQLSLDGPTTLTKGKEKVSDKNQTFLKNKN